MSSSDDKPTLPKETTTKTPSSPPQPQPEKKESLVHKIEDKAKAAIKSDKLRDPQSPSEFVTKNIMRLIEKTYWFMAFLVALYVIVVIVRPEISDKVLTIFALVLGGVLGFIGNNLLGNNKQQNQ